MSYLNRGKKLNDFPAAMAFWDEDANKEIDPNAVAAGSDKKFWWTCLIGSDHKWRAAVKGMTLKSGGCPFCSNRRLSITNALSSTFPILAVEFDAKLNGIEANQVISGSDKKYWWRCVENTNHVWDAMMNKRTKVGRGCPYCAGQRVLPEESFSHIYPKLMEEWDWERNARIDPEKAAPKSDKYVWWICSIESDHTWRAKLNNRANGTGCPYCSNKLVSKENSLSSVYPSLAKEFHKENNFPLSADKVLAGSTKPVWWRCTVNPSHEWELSPYARKGGEIGCPFCSTAGMSKPELRIIAELTPIFSDLEHRRKFSGTEVDIYLPECSIGIEYDGSYWHSDKDDRDHTKNDVMTSKGVQLIRVREQPLNKILPHDVIVKPNRLYHSDIANLLISIRNLAKNLPRTVNSKIDHYLGVDFFLNQNDYLEFVSQGRKKLGTTLRDTNPELMEEWDFDGNAPLVPENFSRGSRDRVKWICKVNPEHKWETPIAGRSSGTQCPFCTNVLTASENSFIHDYPVIAADWHPSKNSKDDILSFSKTSKRKKVWWQCSKNTKHEWQATVSERCRGEGLGCPFCSNKRISESNNLQSTHPKLAAQWHPSKNGLLTPNDVFAGGKQKVWWLCPVADDHQWEARLYSRSKPDGKMKNGCPFCSNQLLSQTNNLFVTNQRLLKEWDFTKNKDTDPKRILPTSKTSAYWICSKNPLHKWQAEIANRACTGSKCPYCIGKLILNTESLDKTHPTLALQWDYARNEGVPRDYSSKSRKRVWWNCPKGKDHIWEAQIPDRIIRGRTDNKISACPFCANRKISVSNSLAVTHPTLAKQWHPSKNKILSPCDVTFGSGKKVWWQCPDGEDHQWETQVCSRATNNGTGEIASGCPFCAGQRACSGHNLLDLYPKIAEEWDYDKNETTPEQCLPYTNRKYWWKCSHLHSWQSSMLLRTKNNKMCPLCRDKD